MIFASAAPKPCRVCGDAFVPFLTTQAVCGARCARKVGQLVRKAAKADLRAAKARLDELRPLSYWAKQAQTAFNSWIRWRDRAQPCISCGTFTGAFDAGHYRSVGSAPELRFDEANVHRQCAMNCNHHKGGNALEYRKGLIARIGQAEVDRLEGPHEPKRYRKDDYIAIRDQYRARLKAEQKETA